MLCVYERERERPLCCFVVVLCLIIATRHTPSLFFQPPTAERNKASNKETPNRTEPNTLFLSHSLSIIFSSSFFFFSLGCAINPPPDPFNFSFLPYSNIFVFLTLSCFSQLPLYPFKLAFSHLFSTFHNNFYNQSLFFA